MKNMFQKKHLGGLVALLSLAILACGTVQASVIVSQNSSNVETTFDSQISATDLINIGQASFVSSANTVAAVNMPGLEFGINGTNDGATASYATDQAGAVAKNSWYLYADPSTTLTYTLNTDSLTGGSATGYDITGVNVFAGWRDADLFESQKWTLRVATLANPTFADIQSVDYSAPGGSLSSKVSLTDSTGTIASGVTAIQLYVQVPSKIGNFGIVFREIDVVGTASVPEPSTLGLLAAAMGIGGFAVARRRRRV
jgi:hypothetical protein